MRLGVSHPKVPKLPPMKAIGDFPDAIEFVDEGSQNCWIRKQVIHGSQFRWQGPHLGWHGDRQKVSLLMIRSLHVLLEAGPRKPVYRDPPSNLDGFVTG